MLRTVFGTLNYVGAMHERPRFHANDHSRDVLALEPHSVTITDARSLAEPPSLRREGIELVRHTSAVQDFRDRTAVTAVHRGEIERLVSDLSGADRVVVASPGVLRFGERSAQSGKLDNSLPARFVHVDVSNPTAAELAERSRPSDAHAGIRRFAHYNVWRVLTPPPQDVPLTVCDARTVAPHDLVAADAVFDQRDAPEWSFEALVVRHNAAHRWLYFSNMTRDEAIVFKTHDSDTSQPSQVPHSAFDEACPAGVAPRASIEMRAIAYWF
jgi:hypothetical protein